MLKICLEIVNFLLFCEQLHAIELCLIETLHVIELLEEGCKPSSTTLQEGH